MASKPRVDKDGQQEVETRPDGWERFETAVDAAVKGGPKHRLPKATLGPKRDKKGA
jgi:hypothetical protein